MRSTIMTGVLLVSTLLAPGCSEAQEAARPLTFEMVQRAMDAAE